jgi:hypothetical protein
MKKINSKTIPKNKDIEGVGKKLFDTDLANKQVNNNYNSDIHPKTKK